MHSFGCTTCHVHPWRRMISWRLFLEEENFVTLMLQRDLGSWLAFSNKGPFLLPRLPRFPQAQVTFPFQPCELPGAPSCGILTRVDSLHQQSIRYSATLFQIWQPWSKTFPVTTGLWATPHLFPESALCGQDLGKSITIVGTCSTGTDSQGWEAMFHRRLTQSWTHVAK